jgi:hypothetical protein
VVVLMLLFGDYPIKVAPHVGDLPEPALLKISLRILQN